MHHSFAAKIQEREIRVWDWRSDDGSPPKKLKISGLDFFGFMRGLRKVFSISPDEHFVLVTMDPRTVIDRDQFERLASGTTLYLLLSEDQSLPAVTKEDISFVPHYDTLLQSGTFEYYANSKESLPYALAELVDNSLSATATNKGVRRVEIRTILGKTPAVIILDNGRGMTSKQLNDWAVYRLSKFKRETDTFESQNEGYVRPDHVPRSLNSDISYFGVGGKNACFFIGDSVKMITKSASSPEVHELILSKTEFERREENNEDVYKGTIVNRKTGDSSHVSKDDSFLRDVIAEETEKESFTAVVITGVKKDHVEYLKKNFHKLATELAHVYHYYIHGVDGNDKRKASKRSSDFLKIDILLTLWDKFSKSLPDIHLRDVVDDMQTLYIETAAESFEFRAFADSGTVEGVIRYHPFLYDTETYPEDPNAAPASVNDEDDDSCENEPAAQNRARGKRDIFECYWNGRLIPYTTVSEFDWCSWNSKSPVPAECFGRLSGVLFTDDRFQVSTNKLHFMDLELKLKDKETIFTPILNPQQQKHSKRGNIRKDFKQWLQNCHAKHDKQVKFRGYKETISRPELNKRMQHPWATFSSIEWDGKTYRAGQLVKSQNTSPIYHGTIAGFLLFGTHGEDVFATGGQVEIKREPVALYGMPKILPITKIDRNATNETIQAAIEKDLDKLPEKLTVDWPEGNSLSPNDIYPAGTVFGPLKVEILNSKGDKLSRIQTKDTIKNECPKKDHVVVQFLAPHTDSGYWFKKIDRLTNLGKYTLTLTTQVKDFNLQRPPSWALTFTVKEGEAVGFAVGGVRPTVRVGVPFHIPLQMKDRFGHQAAPPLRLQPELRCSDLDLSYMSVDSSKNTFSIKGVKAIGKVRSDQQSEGYELRVKLPGLQNYEQTVRIALLPGEPHSLHVKSEAAQLEVENGNPAIFDVEIHDQAGNITANPKQSVSCQVEGLPRTTTDCSSTGAGRLVTKPINLKITNGEPQTLKVTFEMPHLKKVAPRWAELKVSPSRRVSAMRLYCDSGDGQLLALRNDDRLERRAGAALGTLSYRLFDESGREAPLTAETAAATKVNWTSDVDREGLVQGRLPDVPVPTQVKEERFCQVSYQHQDVSFNFTVVPCPDDPKQLKATLPRGAVKLGETLQGHIVVELVDQFDNVTQKLTPACAQLLTLEAEGLHQSGVTYTWQSGGSVRVAGLRFDSGPPGARDLSFRCGRYEGSSSLRVTPGVPAQLRLIRGPEQPLQVLNGCGIPTPFLVQLFDGWGNPSPDQEALVEITPSSPTLQVTTDVVSQPPDAEGKASFTVNCVSGPKGYYQLEFRSSLNGVPISSTSVSLTVIADPSKPVGLSVEYDPTARFPAGGTFPAFSLVVVSDEGSPVTTFSPTAVAMFVKREGPSGSPQTVSELKCSKPMENDKPDRFYFRDKKIPERVGKYVVDFSLSVDQTNVLRSKQICVDVVANRAVQLAPDSPPAPPVVSHSGDPSGRTLVKSMALQVQDAFGNPAGQDLTGTVVVSIKRPDPGRDVPLFERRMDRVRVSLDKGRAHILGLAIMENSPGQNDSQYVLLFQPEVPLVSLSPYELPFHFYNDAENLGKVTRLNKNKHELMKTLAQYEEIMISRRALSELFTRQVATTKQKEVALREELVRRNMDIVGPLSTSDIDKLLQEKKTQAENLQKQTRVSSIPNNFSGPDVLGTVAHLAVVEDDEAARVISWHLRGDMDCVVTATTEAAQRIHRDTRGNQQVLPLDGFLEPDDRPLPHLRNGHSLFDPPGNPVHARKLLIYPNEKEKCNKVFKNLLGDTILMDDLDSATRYRKMLVERRIRCPAILTRGGDLVSARGKFGGRQNRAPPPDGRAFGAPLPPPFHTLKKDMELLAQYRELITKVKMAEKELEDHAQTDGAPEMQRKREKQEELKKQLDEIDRELAFLSVRSGKRVLESAGEASGISPKRPRRT
ncbi:structural maintenance of chromosomes flexible hinge domain-containing protein 1 [Menidia menidia]